jgi:hypothetical protein
MHPPIKNRVFHKWVILTLLGFLPILNASAFSTGIPLKFSIDPATIRQQDKDESEVLATVILTVPSPTYFICQIRSSDRNGVTFNDIVFKKGQIQGTSSGIIHWQRILKDGDVKVSAFSVDAPGEKLWFTITLKTKDENEPEDGQEPAAQL